MAKKEGRKVNPDLVASSGSASEKVSAGPRMLSQARM